MSETLPVIGWRKPGAVAALVWRRMMAGRVSLISAGCAFYATLALFPGLSVLLSLYGLVFNPVSVVPQLDLLHNLLPTEAFTLIAQRVNALVSHERDNLQLGVWIGTAVALWSASTGTKSLLSAIDEAHGERDRGFFQFQLTGLAMTLAATIGAVLALAILVALPNLLLWLGIPATTRGLLHVLSLALLLAFVCASIAALFRFGPSPRPGPPPLVLPGALAATVLWVAASAGFSFYVSAIGSFDITYGPIAAIAGVMLWFWVSCFVVLFGAELNAALRLMPPKQKRPEANPRPFSKPISG